MFPRIFTAKATFLLVVRIFLVLFGTLSSALDLSSMPRRKILDTLISIPPIMMNLPDQAFAEDSSTDLTSRPFETAGFLKKELTNSIVASRDTNISPLEVYETIQSRLRKNNQNKNARALDVGAGAGVSTQVIYQQLGYTTIDAIDWSGTAWETNVVEGGYCPPTVKFYELDDERFVQLWKKEGLQKYDIIAFNFAINKDKAIFFCKELLKPDGILLAPINTQRDYWLKQTYQLLDAEGQVSWSASDVGAWSVQFQPDVTNDNCQGVWCAPFNGFQKLRK